MIIKAFKKEFDINKTDNVTNKNLLVELSEQLTKEQKRNNDLIKLIEQLTIEFTAKL